MDQLSGRILVPRLPVTAVSWYGDPPRMTSTTGSHGWQWFYKEFILAKCVIIGEEKNDVNSGCAKSLQL